MSLLTPTLVAAGPVTSLYVLGDSLSDQGNGFLLTGGTFPPPPYVQRASNGPVAVERLAEALGVPLAPSAAGGTNYAVLGATTGPVAIPGSSPPVTTENFTALQYGQPALAGTSLQSQALAILQAGPITDAAGSLFVVWGGANDFFVSPSPATAAGAVGNLAGVITALYGGGARNFLVLNLPDLSRTPSGQSLPATQQAGLQALTLGFNNGLASAVSGLSGLPGIELTLFDTFGFFNTLLTNPGTFGLSNTSTPCLSGNLQAGGAICADPDAYVFWDSVHPTTAAHRALGDALAAAAVPEPATVILVSLGMGLAAARRRRAA
ncbi:MAG: SGNH/GDSL hydrolase family protein [Acidobacteria bacterium]|nr:SGNH/GDSL hydrolase family protein [Acidobacteriota bacterium]